MDTRLRIQPRIAEIRCHLESSLTPGNIQSQDRVKAGPRTILFARLKKASGWIRFVATNLDPAPD